MEPHVTGFAEPLDAIRDGQYRGLDAETLLLVGVAGRFFAIERAAFLRSETATRLPASVTDSLRNEPPAGAYGWLLEIERMRAVLLAEPEELASRMPN